MIVSVSKFPAFGQSGELSSSGMLAFQVYLHLTSNCWLLATTCVRTIGKPASFCGLINLQLLLIGCKVIQLIQALQQFL